jgi:hypothetical protein
VWAGPIVKLPRITADAWRKAALGIVVLAAAIAAFSFVGGYLDFRRELAGMKGVRLNDSRAEVMYRLGSPPRVLGPQESSIVGAKVAGQSWAVLEVGGKVGNSNVMPADNSVNEYKAWAYELDNNYTDMIVLFDKNDRVDSITCTAQNDEKFSCGPLAGVHNTDPEDIVLKLGVPSTNTVEGGYKNIEYADIGVGYMLTKGKAYSFTLSRPTGGEGAVLRRYFERLLP